MRGPAAEGRRSSQKRHRAAAVTAVDNSSATAIKSKKAKVSAGVV
jgi:hypothetical protein